MKPITCEGVFSAPMVVHGDAPLSVYGDESTVSGSELHLRKHGSNLGVRSDMAGRKGSELDRRLTHERAVPGEGSIEV